MSKAKRMSQSQWDAWLSSVLDKARKRIERLEAARAGDVRFRTVKVESYKVSAYKVGAHTRVIEDRRQQKQATKTTLRVLRGGRS